jgi:hypothetical protein
MTRARTISEFHYNSVFIDAIALTSEAHLHAELRFKLGLPSDYTANWETLIDCLSSIGNPRAHLCRHWEYSPSKRLVLSIRGFSATDIDPTLLVSLAGAVASANDRLRDDHAANRVWIEFTADPVD